MGLLVKLAVLVGVVGGASYAVVRALMNAKQERILAELKTTHAELEALKQKRRDGELSEDEYGELSMAIYQAARDRGVPLDADEEKGAES